MRRLSVHLLPALSIGTLLACLAAVAFVLLHNLDRGLEAPMLEDPRHSLRHQLRDLLGVNEILTHLHRLEKQMATDAEKLNALSDKVDDIAADVRVLATKSGQLDAEGQAALDRLTGKLSDLDAEVGDQDGSDNPEQPEA